MKRIIIPVLVFLSLPAFSQLRSGHYNRPLNDIHVGLSCDGALFSLNYERFFILSDGILLSAKVGIGYNEEFQLCIWGPCSAPQKYLLVPHHISVNLGRKRNFLELGVGGAWVDGRETSFYTLFPLAGYRYHPWEAEKVVLRAYAYFPVIGYEKIDFFFLPVGLSLGVAF